MPTSIISLQKLERTRASGDRWRRAACVMIATTNVFVVVFIEINHELDMKNKIILYFKRYFSLKNLGFFTGSTKSNFCNFLLFYET